MGITKLENGIEQIKYKEYTNSKNVIVSFLIAGILGVIGSYSTSILVCAVTGFIGTLYICYKITQLNLGNSFILLFGVQFLRAVIRIYLGSSNYSFLLIVIPVFILKYLIERSWKIRIIELVPILLLIIDLVVSVMSYSLAVGDQILWCLAFMVLLIVNYDDIKIDLNLIITILGLAIWAICIVNVLAEISRFGQTLVPSMYGTWTASGEYYSFGKGFTAIAGGNEITQYITIFVALAILNYKNETKMGKFFYIVSSLFFLYCGLLCIARAFYVELFIFILLYAVAKSRNPLRLIAVLGVFTIALVLVYLQFYDRISMVIDAVLIRFDSGYSDRISLIEGAINILASNPLITIFGAGSQYMIQYENATAHNIIADAMVSLGVIGGTIYLATIAMCFISSFRKRVYYLENLIPVIMFLAYKMISGRISDVPFYFMIVLVTAALMEGRFSGQKKRNK